MHAPTIIDSLRLHGSRRKAAPASPWGAVGGIEIVPTALGVRIVCRANCSLPPARFVAALACAAAISLLVAAGFWLIGAPWVLPFAGLELLGLAVAVVLVARRAGDCETITLTAATLEVHRLRSGRASSFQLERAWLQSPRADAAGLVELRGREGRSLLGTTLAAADRPALLACLRNALNGRPVAAAERESSILPT